MIYLLITAGIFFLDGGIKRRIDKKYSRKVQHPHLRGAVILEKYYNDGAALNFLAKKPKLMRGIHTIVLAGVGICYYLLLHRNGKPLEKAGVAMLFGGGCSNLYDRYTKGHVVDYVRINKGPKWLKNIIFNVSDFCIFIGALMAVAGNGGR